MKRILALLLALILSFSFMACKEEDTDFQNLQAKGKLIVGITEYPNMNYKENGKWTGFESEFATLFAQKLNLEVEFKEIVWADRYDELINGKIDCIWNALSVMKHDQKNVSMSNPYIYNDQVLVMKADVIKNYPTGDGLKRLKFVSEEGSSSERVIFDEGYRNTYTVKSQDKALADVSSGKADATIIDSILAGAVVGKGKKYENLGVGLTFASETCAVAFRIDSDLTEKFNSFLEEIKEDKLNDLANKYGLTLY